MNYRLVAIDMDGTTLNSKHKISLENLDTIKKVHELGVKVIIMTGRMYYSALEYYNKIGLDTLIVTYNGGKIHDFNGNIKYKKELSNDVVSKLLKLPNLKENKVLPLFFIDEKLVVPWYDENTEEYEMRTGIKAIVDENILKKTFETTKFLLSSTNYKYLDFLKDNIIKTFGNSLYITNSMPRYVEVLNKEVSKGNALIYCSDYYNIPLNQCVVIGDNNNDSAMFLPEVYKIAVKNAEQNLKNLADFITESNDCNGVSLALRKIFFGE
ncbi:MAG: Cof-type HAD-IIB family hydrolase [Candidatus Muirbacterium halophilum]|nr:Cof-type HAD-IIB family hydrolase [Candidatus Muirbacterium halophilum]MCK9476002.1 Cof-type HAD-IIB family hydrolase [Candidatus Muirbacterium halophilum]